MGIWIKEYWGGGTHVTPTTSLMQSMILSLGQEHISHATRNYKFALFIDCIFAGEVIT